MKISRRLASPLTATLAALLGATSVYSQAPREVTLGKAEARFNGEFSLIRGIRELTNGSVLIADPINSLFTRLDASFQKMDTLGRIGRGPGEYIQPDGIWPLSADSSLLVDLGNNRLTVVAPNGRLGKTMPLILADQNSDGPPRMVLVEGTDRTGGIWFAGRANGDSTPVFRMDRATQNVTSVINIKGPPVKREEGGTAEARSVSIMSIPMGAQDGWAVTATGALYIVHANGYRVDVIAANKTRITGTPTPFTPVPIGDAEKQEWTEEMARGGGLNMNVNDDGSGPVFQISRLRASGARPRSNLPWPAVKPPFNADELFVDARDRLWVSRYQKAGLPKVYDVFDLTGKRVGSVRLPAARSIVGIGTRGLYIANLDANDVQSLERYALPL